MVQIGGRTGSSWERGSTKRPIRVRSPDFTPLRGRRDWPSRQSTGRGGDRRIRDSPSEDHQFLALALEHNANHATIANHAHSSLAKKKDKEGHMRKLTTAITAAALA